MISVYPKSRKLFFLSPFRTVLFAMNVQVTDRPSPDAPSLTQAMSIGIGLCWERAMIPINPVNRWQTVRARIFGGGGGSRRGNQLPETCLLSFLQTNKRVIPIPLPQHQHTFCQRHFNKRVIIADMGKTKNYMPIYGSFWYLGFLVQTAFFVTPRVKLGVISNIKLSDLEILRALRDVRKVQISTRTCSLLLGGQNRSLLSSRLASAKLIINLFNFKEKVRPGLPSSSSAQRFWPN